MDHKTLDSSYDQRLDAAIKRRNHLSREIERLHGRKEEAERNLRAVDDECRAKKFEPDQIDQVIEQLEQRYHAQVALLEQQIAEAEKQLSPYLGDTV